MDPRKVGNLIKDLRKKNGLTQKDLADKYGVTYQAVSKWENGTNLPDISLIKEICNDYNLDVNDFLDGNHIVNKKKKNYKWLFIIPILLLLIFEIFVYCINSNKSFKFKTLTTTCDAFNVTGSVAYDKNNSSIYISNINYCGGDDVNKYDSLTCKLYENDIVIYECDTKNDIKLEDYLKEIKIKADHYEQTCKLYKDDSLKLSIEAKEGNKTTSYDIPLHLDDEC